MVATHNLERFVLCEQAHTGVDIAAIRILHPVLHVIGHVSVVDDTVACLIIKVIEQGHQRVGLVVHVAGDEYVMLRLLRVLRSKLFPGGCVHVA